jgi:uncharacterized protein YndB with AHSA1/START domain
MVRHVGVIEFELERTINAPIDLVFARLVDIEGYNGWMPKKGSIRRHTEQTSPGEPTVGTSYVDHTRYGPTPGEIAELAPPHRLVFHWWNRSKTGKTRFEGWPGYSLVSEDESTTLVRHDATMQTYGLYRLAGPVLRQMAVRERTTTIDALTASFAPSR